MAQKIGHWMIAAIVAALSLTGAASAAAQSGDARVAAMIAAVNAARAAEGYAQVSEEPRLTAAACRQARDLAGRALHEVADLSHRGSDGSDLGQRLADAGYRFRTAAENLAAGTADPAETVRLWLASEGHRRNILTAGFREAGAAYLGPHLSPGGNRRGPLDVWVLVLASPGPNAGAAGRQVKNPMDCRR